MVEGVTLVVHRWWLSISHQLPNTDLPSSSGRRVVVWVSCGHPLRHSP